MQIVTDAMQGQIMAHFSVSAGTITELFPSRTEPLLGALVALEEVCFPYSLPSEASYKSTIALHCETVKKKDHAPLTQIPAPFR